jgi:hypothetical protein
LLVAAGALSLLVTLTAFAQSAGPQPSTQNIEELRRRLAELEKEVKELRQAVTHLEEQQMRATQAAATPPPQQPTGTGATPQQRPITDLAKQDMVKRDRETIPRIDNKPVDPELTGFFRIPGTQSKLKIDGYAKLDTMIDFRTPVKEGADFRFYAEVDFFGASGPTDPRLRHL